jgi:esterase/lipase superfamily enzyme
MAIRFIHARAIQIAQGSFGFFVISWKFSMKTFFTSSSSLLALIGVAASSFVANAQSPELQDQPKVDIFYATNRAPATSATGSMTYGAERSHSLAFGSVDVFGKDANNSVIGQPAEIGRFPETPYSLEKTKKGVRRSNSEIIEHQRSAHEMHNELQRRIAGTKRKEVIIFIHGYNNSFDDAIKSTAQLCNDLGPDDFTCIALTWPAGGSKGVLFGYNVDRESGEFAVADLRKAIRIISSTPNLRAMHFVAHSRGTDVLSSVIQQLAIETYVAQSSIAEKLKISNVVLAAPDIDLDVAFSKILGLVSDPDLLYGKSANQRVIYNPGKFHLTVYSSTGDRALSLSKTLFGSDMRLGLLDTGTSQDKLDRIPKAAGLADFITVEDGGGFIGHSYFLSDQSVRHDLVELIKNGRGPAAPERSLIEEKKPLWFLPSRTSAH